ncbi:MAG: AMP-binding protein [Bacteroidia bacterium]
MSETPFNITSFFFRAAATYPDKIAIIHKDESITFSVLAEQVQETAAYLTNKGILKGDRVMIFIPMGIDLYRTVLALFHMGATAVFLDEWVNKKRLEACCRVATCKAFIGIPKARALALVSKELRNIPVRLGVKCHSGFRGKTVEVNVFDTDTALITFTTGSTGIPKAAKRTHGFLKEQFTALLEKIDPRPEDIDMPVLPIVLLINLGAGCTSVITSFKASKPEAMDAAEILEQIKRLHVTRMVSSPFFVKQLAEYQMKNGLTELPHLKKIFTGGAPVFPSEAALYGKAFPEAKLEIVYGSTEAEPISSISAEELLKEEGALLNGGLKVGTPYHRAKVRIITITKDAIQCTDEASLDKLTLPAGSIGEIIVSGPHVLTEYFNNEEALKLNKIFIGSTCWHRTGDSGYLDSTGTVFLCGRCTTLVCRGTKLIAPFIYENYFQTIPGVEMGTVMENGSSLFAILELKKNADKAEVTKQVMLSSEEFTGVKFIPRMPRDPRHHSKIDYGRLRSGLLTL